VHPSFGDASIHGGAANQAMVAGAADIAFVQKHTPFGFWGHEVREHVREKTHVRQAIRHSTHLAVRDVQKRGTSTRYVRKVGLIRGGMSSPAQALRPEPEPPCCLALGAWRLALGAFFGALLGNLGGGFFFAWGTIKLITEVRGAGAGQM
jgi:hypothetical protein